MSTLWGMAFGAPSTVAVVRDRSDDAAVTVRDAANGILQLSIGALVVLVLVRDGERITIAGTELGERVLTRVASVEREFGLAVEERQAVEHIEVHREPQIPAHEASGTLFRPGGRVDKATPPAGARPAASVTAPVPTVLPPAPAPAEALPSAAFEETAVSASSSAAFEETAVTAAPSGGGAAPVPPAAFEDTLASASFAAFEETVASAASSVAFDETVVSILDQIAVVAPTAPTVFDALSVRESTGPASTASAAPPRSDGSYRVRITLGPVSDLHEVAGSLYVGRAPVLPAEVDPRQSALAVVGADGDRISATHLQLSVVAGRLLARDLWSTNGTVITPPGGSPFRLGRGEQLPVVIGARLTIGGEAVIDVEGTVERGA